jgi:redox-sensitive bicupin YhaK (pirin superfamily)
MSKVDTPRSISTVFNAKNRNNGGDSSVRIIIGGHAVRTLDPFLMYGHYTVPPPGGFPDHPHRGFETVGYMLEGNLEHEDFGGHRGIVHPGDVQWMTAGRGIMHSEMAVGDRDAVILHLWVNLPEKDRLCEPAYQEVKRDEMPRVYPLGRDGGAEVKIIAGKQFGVASSVTTRTLIIYLDVTLEAGKQIHHVSVGIR